ncbi:hypothetical protein RIR_jg34307.t1 [Rhizophagus irregularis DAOM 181602=DAOM 197198]|nr:hypothetical protein RIR_jg34307.t1 [Rhizophagus irregularis DAOM 181602=DAOM 197198]
MSDSNTVYESESICYIKSSGFSLPTSSSSEEDEDYIKKSTELYLGLDLKGNGLLKSWKRFRNGLEDLELIWRTALKT